MLECGLIVGLCRMSLASIHMPERYSRIINSRVRSRSPAMEAPDLEAYIYWHANAHDEPANAWLRQQIVRALH